jgi:hypothetical protein
MMDTGRKTSYIYTTNLNNGIIISKIKPKKNKNGSHLLTQKIIYRKSQNFSKTPTLKIAFKTTSTIGKLLNEKQETNSYEQSGIYKLTCQSCHKVYIGQTGRNLEMRYKEHIRNIRFNKYGSAFTQHILHKRHQYRQ